MTRRWRPTPRTDPRQPEWRKLGVLLQRARERAELTMREVSLRAGHDESLYGMIERGQRRPSSTLLLRLVRLLDLTPAEEACAIDRLVDSYFADLLRPMPPDKVRARMRRRLRQ